MGLTNQVLLEFELWRYSQSSFQKLVNPAPGSLTSQLCFANDWPSKNGMIGMLVKIHQIIGHIRYINFPHEVDDWILECYLINIQYTNMQLLSLLAPNFIFKPLAWVNLQHENNTESISREWMTFFQTSELTRYAGVLVDWRGRMSNARFGLLY